MSKNSSKKVVKYRDPEDEDLLKAAKDPMKVDLENDIFSEVAETAEGRRQRLEENLGKIEKTKADVAAWLEKNPISEEERQAKLAELEEMAVKIAGSMVEIEQSNKLHKVSKEEIALATQYDQEKRIFNPRLLDAIADLDPESEHLDLKQVTKALREGASPNAVFDETGDTAIHGAAYFKDPRLAQLLLDSGASISVKNKAGKTPLEVAMEQGNFAVIRKFTKHDPSQQSTSRKTLIEDVKASRPLSPTTVARSNSPTNSRER